MIIGKKKNALCNSQQIVPVYTFVLPNLIVCTYAACIDHDATLLVSFRIQQVVAFRTEMERRLRVIVR